MATTRTSSPVSLATFRGSASRRRKEGLIKGALVLAAGFSLVISLAIVAALTGQAVRFLTEVDLSASWASGWFPRRGEFDIATIFIGTMEVSLIAMAIATPLGLGAAMYLSEYARPRSRRLLKPILETLAGIPSVVLGYFALQTINPAITQDLFGGTSPFSILAAGVGVGILTLATLRSSKRAA